MPSSPPTQLSGCRGQKMSVIMTGWKPTCWKWGETGHHSSSCPDKKAYVVLAPTDTNLPLAESVNSVWPVIDMPASKTSAIKPPIGSISRPPFSKKLYPALVQLGIRKRRSSRSLVKPKTISRELDLCPREPLRVKAQTAPLPLQVPWAMPRFVTWRKAESSD